jgi:hypothetical protein
MTNRNVRNLNPGNIEHGADWDGLADVQPDSRFCSFVTAQYGFRAMVKIFRTYRRKYDLKTPRQIIHRWAPPSENDTAAYVRNVCTMAQLDPDVPLDDTAQSYAILAAYMAVMEGWPDADLERAGQGAYLAYQ